MAHAVSENKWDKAETYAKEYLETAEQYKDNWNYGNAIFYGNITLSRGALYKNEMILAKKYFIRASKTPGSAQLNSFGPFVYKNTTTLISELLHKKEKKVVIEFLNNCRIFLNHESTKKLTPDEQKLKEKVQGYNNRYLDHVILQVQSNEIPDFKFLP